MSKARSERRRRFLHGIESLICGVRQDSYGDAEDNFRDIAEIWSVLLGRKLKEPLSSVDVGYLMIGMKLARTINSPWEIDHAKDMAGYAGCVGGILMGMAHEHVPTVPERPDHPQQGDETGS